MNGDHITGLMEALEGCFPTQRSCFRTGSVRIAGGGRLSVSCNGLTLDPDDLYIDAGLDFNWTLDSGEKHFLRAGDRVVLLTADDQIYYLMARVLAAGGGAG